MSPPPLLLAIAGTRPEVIKLAPVVKALRERGSRVALGVTGQHQGLLAQALADCNLEPTFDLAVMEPNQALGPLLARILTGLEAPLRSLAPALVIVQGDTTSALGGALAAFSQRIPVAHVEAGLRSGNLAVPFPEEANRRLIATLARWHFAPSQDAADALVREGVDPGRIEVTGNTVIDACLTSGRDAQVPAELQHAASRMVLVTLHRREILQAPGVLKGVFGALERIALDSPGTGFWFPAHPSVAEAAHETFDGLANFQVLPPQPHSVFLALLREACLAISDSGGVQEEGSALGTPVALVRAETERPEAIAAGGVVLTGLDPKAIEEVVHAMLRAAEHGNPTFPYGRGGASAQIALTLSAHLS